MPFARRVSSRVCEVQRVAECFISLNFERVGVGAQASLCGLALSHSPANNVPMAARSPRRVGREMCNLTLVSATQSLPYINMLACCCTKR